MTDYYMDPCTRCGEFCENNVDAKCPKVTDEMRSKWREELLKQKD